VNDALPTPTGLADTGLASLVQIFVRLFQLYGVDANAVLGECGIDPALGQNPNARVPGALMEEVLRRGAELIRDPAFGLRAARCWHPGNLGVIGHAWLSSSTLRTGLKRIERYWRILGPRAEVIVDDGPSGLKFVIRRKRLDPVIGPIHADIVLSIALDMCRFNAGAALRPTHASLRRQRPADAAPYERFFGCPVAFGAEENSFTVAREDAEAPLPTGNRQLAAVFDKLLVEQLARLDKNDVVSRCKAALFEQLASGEVSEEEMAKALNMSRRTLQRRLAESELTYLQLVDDTRKDLALRYVEDPSMSITDITFLLGFSQQSAFTRAFKRWMGITPTEYRERTTAPTA
jgi:AraC-like DNA-binding protein